MRKHIFVAATTSLILCGGASYLAKCTYDRLRSKLCQPSLFRPEGTDDRPDISEYILSHTCPLCDQPLTACSCHHAGYRRWLISSRAQLAHRLRVMVESVKPWLQIHTSDDPWSLVRLSEDVRQHVRLMAVTGLAEKHIAWPDSLCQAVGQACDARTIVGLARSGRDCSRLLLKPPFSYLNYKEVLSDELHDFLLSLPDNVTEDKCTLYYKTLALKKKRKPSAHEQDDLDMIWVFGSDRFRPQVIEPTENYLLTLYLQALYSYCSELQGCESLVQAGGLPLLLHVWKHCPDQPHIRSLVIKTISSIAVHSSLHGTIIDSGWVYVLHQALAMSSLEVEIQAATALSNLDVEFGEINFHPGLYLLHPLHRESNIHADVVFVHGLMGSPFHTWRQKEDGTRLERLVARPDIGPYFIKTKQNKHGKTRERGSEVLPAPTVVRPGCVTLCWPSCWLPQEMPHLRVLGVGYPTHISDWLPSCPHHVENRRLKHRARAILNQLKQAQVGRGGRPVILVGHSMGGLIMKELLVQANEGDERDKQIVNNVKGVVFFSVPHHGSPIADKLTRVNKILLPSVEVQQLKVGQELDDLHTKFMKLVEKKKFRCLSFGELMKTEIGKKQVGVGYKSHLVLPESSDLGYGDMYYVDTTHHYICKPVSPESPQFQLLISFLAQTLTLQSMAEAAIKAASSELDSFTSFTAIEDSFSGLSL